MNTTVTDRPAAENEQRPPDWWHRDHPTFTALTGFFTGLAFVALVPALFVGLLHLVFDDETTNDLFPMVLVALAVPLGLVAFSRTRRFGAYMQLGGCESEVTQRASALGCVGPAPNEAHAG